MNRCVPRAFGRRVAFVAWMTPFLPLWLGGCDAGPVPESPPPTVAWATLTSYEGAASVAYAGLVRSATRTELGFESGGRLVSRAVDVGDTVGRGDVLATLDGAGLESLVASAEADVQSAAARRDGAARDETRIADLAADEAVSRAELEAATDERRAAAAALDLSRARLAAARQRRDDARLAAPFDGVVVAVGADVGDTVVPGLSVLTIADPAKLEVVVDVPSARAASIRTGAPADIAPELRLAQRIGGTVSRVAPLADPVTRGIAITVALADGATNVRPGSEVEVSFPDDAGPSVRVPARAVARTGKGAAAPDRVWTLDRSGSPVRVRGIDVVVPANGLVSIDAGLTPGTDIVVSGVGQLVDGQAVTPALESLR